MLTNGQGSRTALNESYLDKLKKKRAVEAAEKRRQQELEQSNSTVKGGSDAVVAEVARQSAKNRTTTQSVKVENQDLAKKQDIDAVIQQLKEVQLAALLGNKETKPSIILADSTDLGDQIAVLGQNILAVIESVRTDNSHAEAMSKIASQYSDLFNSFKSVAESQAASVKEGLSKLERTLDSKDFKPSVTVAAPVVNTPEIDLSPLNEAIKSLEKTVKDNKVVIPKSDFSELVSAMKDVNKTINGIQFPIPNYVLPFRDSDGKATQQTVALPSERVFERVANTDGSSTALTSFGAVSGKKNYARGYSITNTSASNGYVDFRDGTGGSVLWTVPIPANGGANVMLNEPIFWTSANTALAFDVSAALTTVYISVTGYQAG